MNDQYQAFTTMIIIALLAAMLYTAITLGLMSLQCIAVTAINDDIMSPGADVIFKCICILLSAIYAVVACAFFEYVFEVLPCDHGGSFIFQIPHGGDIDIVLNNIDREIQIRRQMTLYASEQKLRNYSVCSHNARARHFSDDVNVCKT